MLLFSYDGGYYLSSFPSVAKLAEVDALPDAHVQPVVGDGDGQACSRQRALGMGGHVVVALACMLVVRFPFLDQAVEDGFQIGLYVGVGVLVQAQSGGGMLDEEVEQSHGRKWRQLRHNFVGHEVEAPSV